MKETLRNLFIFLLLLVPVILFNFGYREIASISSRWEDREQERFARQKLGEIAAHADVFQEISAFSGEFKKCLASLLDEYGFGKRNEKAIANLTESVFARPFPDHEVHVFKRNPGSFDAQLLHSTGNVGSRRSLEMVTSFLLAENLEEKQGSHEIRRNEKMLQKIFGNGCTGPLIGIDQKGLATPVIYKTIPAFLVWDFIKKSDGSILAFLLIVPRNQDLVTAVYKIAAQKAGLGSEFAGGFIRIFQTGAADCLFPQSLMKSGTFKKWRAGLGIAEDNLEKWQQKGFAWGMPLGRMKLYSQILPLEKHLAVLILPDTSINESPVLLKLINALFGMAIVLLLIRGMLLGNWPFKTISSRFLVVFLLAVSLPVCLFLTYAAAYVFERLKADENNLEQTLTTSLLDFDAGKEFLENEYLSVFSQMLKDQAISRILADRRLEGGNAVAQRVREISGSKSLKLPLSGIALFDLEGNSHFESSGSLRKADFATMVRFYGHSFTINLRKVAKKEEPELVLPEQKIDERNLAAMQSIRRGDDGIETEIERFRFRVIRTDVGHGHLSYIYDFIAINGKPRYVLMISWQDIDVDHTVLRETADQLGIKIPQIKLAGYKRTGTGVEAILPPDRSVSDSQRKIFNRIADSAFSIRSGLLKTVVDGMSVVAYASRHFDKTVLIAAIDHEKKNSAHLFRRVVFLCLGTIGLVFLLISAVVTYFRIVRPLTIVKGAFDNVEKGLLVKLPVSSRRDELGLLTREFASMVSGLEERQRLASLLSDQAVAAIAVASDGAAIKSESFHGVVMISDIRDFTTMCEQNEPQMITSLLNTHFAEMAAVITSFDGRIYKFIGDAVEAVFIDDPRIQKTAAERAVLAAASMLARLKIINERRLSENWFSYRIGIGLAEGELAGGETGSKESRRDYAILGPAFKKAEKLESLTRRFPEYPLLVDQKIASSCSMAEFIWIEDKIEGADSSVFRLAGNSVIALASSGSSEISMVSGSNPVMEQAESVVDKFHPKGESALSNCRPYVFFAGLFAVFFPVLAWFITFRTSNEAVLRREQSIAATYCDNARIKINVPDSQTVILEQYLDSLSEELADRLGWHPEGVSADALENAGARMYDELSKNGLQPSLFAVLHKPGNGEIKDINQDWCLLNYLGPDLLRDPCKELMQCCALRYYFSWATSLAKIKMTSDKIRLITGTGISFPDFYNDLHARVNLSKRAGVEECFYWQPILMRNRKLFQDVKNEFSSEKLRQRPGADLLLQVGILMCVIPKEMVFKSHLATLINTLKFEQVEFAIVPRTGTPYYSPKFPDAARQYGFNDASVVLPGWYLTSTVIEHQGNSIRLFFGRPLRSADNRLQYLIALSLIFLSFTAAFAWYKAVFREEGIATKFAWQLWLGLIAAAIVPLTVVYTVNEWFAIEQAELNIAQERVKMIRHFDELERRQFIQEVIEWDKLYNLSFDKDFQQAISMAIAGGNEAGEELKTVVNKLAAREDARGDRVRFSELLISHASGWKQTIYPLGQKEREAGDFKRFIEALTNRLFADLGVNVENENFNKKPLGGAVKDEMTREAGLEIFRTIFGVDNYFKVVHGPDLPIKVFMATGLGCFKLILCPSLMKPEMIVFWLFFDSLNSTMRSIFKTAESEYPVFTEAKVMYGALKQPWTGGWDPEVTRFARWAIAKKSPLSSRTVFAGRECLVEARIGSHNDVMIMVGLIPENVILKKVEDSRQQFLFLLILSIIAIVLLSLLVAGDIAVPIHQLTVGVKMIASQRFDYRISSTRSDELGQILLSFNRMARGMQEKELMGQMVSSAARRMASNEESLLNAEKGQHLNVTVLYLAVPGFDCLVNSLSSSNLIEDVRGHVDSLCRIIMDNGGEVDKLIGEKILAYFYSPAGIEESNIQALHAMRAIRAAERAGHLAFPVTVGLHCGEVIAGLLGIGNKRDFTIIGDPVNTAARICAKASGLPFDRFLVSEDITRLLHENAFSFRAFGEVELKGKAGTVNLCQVLFDR